MLINELTGNSQQHLTTWNDQLVHHDVVNALAELTDAAKQAGFQLTIASGFRDFQRQLLIWNNKFSGKRPAYDKSQNIVDLSSLTDWQKVQAIMLYSAIPGTSRHHWGCDFDVYDKSKINENYQLQLESHEYQLNGPFYQLTEWLNKHASDFGFYFPYQNIKNGVANEPWHLSYFPVANTYTESLNSRHVDLLNFIEQSEILGKQAILDNFEYILSDYVLNLAKFKPSEETQ